MSIRVFAPHDIDIDFVTDLHSGQIILIGSKLLRGNVAFRLKTDIDHDFIAIHIDDGSLNNFAICKRLERVIVSLFERFLAHCVRFFFRCVTFGISRLFGFSFGCCFECITRIVISCSRFISIDRLFGFSFGCCFECITRIIISCSRFISRWGCLFRFSIISGGFWFPAFSFRCIHNFGGTFRILPFRVRCFCLAYILMNRLRRVFN